MLVARLAAVADSATSTPVRCSRSVAARAETSPNRSTGCGTVSYQHEHQQQHHHQDVSVQHQDGAGERALRASHADYGPRRKRLGVATLGRGVAE